MKTPSYKGPILIKTNLWNERQSQENFLEHSRREQRKHLVLNTTYPWHRAGPCGTKAFLCPLVSICRRWVSSSLHDLPWVPTGRFKQLLIREGKGCRDKGRAVKKRYCSLGKGFWFPFKGYTQQYLGAVSGRYWNLTRWERLTVCPRACRPQTSWNQKADDADSHLPPTD